MYAHGIVFVVDKKSLHMLGRVTRIAPSLDDADIDEAVGCARVARLFVQDFLYDRPRQKSSLIYDKIESVLSLYLFNRLYVRPQMTFEEKEMLVTRMYTQLYNAEFHALELGKYVPTIGLEVEIEEGRKKHNRNRRTNAIIRALGINHEVTSSQYYGEWSDELEINDVHSYSAAVHARLLHELSVMGALRTVQLPRARKQVLKDAHNHVERKCIIDERVVHSRRSMYSLHVNLGLPSVYYSENAQGQPVDSLHSHKLLEKEMQRFSYISLVAFSSKDRMRRRKTKLAHWLNTSADFDGQKEAAYRLELRALEVRDYPTYRMLYELQFLAGCMTAFVQRNKKGGLSTLEHELALVWEHLCADVRIGDVLDAASHNAADAADPSRFISAMFTKNTQRMVRSAIQEYALHAKQILEENLRS